ncbi:MAG TPA: MFS transporter [Deltaproteobacteria bacterium]|nr:MFS transporter [Deltaproteobacteria bacterium]
MGRGLNLSFLVLLIANFFFFLNFSQLMLLPKFIVHLGLGPADIGLIMGMFSISVLIALPFVGTVSEKTDKKKVFIFGTLLMFGATPMYVYVQTLGAYILVLRVIQGVGFSCALGVTAAMVFEIVPDSSRRYLLGVLTVFNISTHAIGPAFGEYIIRTAGFDMFFLTAGCFGFVAFFCGFFLPRVSICEEKKAFALSRAFPHITATAVLGIVFGSAVIFLPPYLMTTGIPDSSLFFVAFVCGSLVVWIFLYKVFHGIGERAAWIVSVILLLMLPSGVSGLNSLAMLVLLSGLFGVGYGYLYPTLNTLFIDDIYPGMRGLSSSLFVWSFNLGMLLASFGFGHMSGTFGYQLSFAITALAGIVLLLFTTRLIRN